MVINRISSRVSVMKKNGGKSKVLILCCLQIKFHHTNRTCTQRYDTVPSEQTRLKLED